MTTLTQNLDLIVLRGQKFGAGTSPSNGAIWDEFSMDLNYRFLFEDLKFSVLKVQKHIFVNSVTSTNLIICDFHKKGNPTTRRLLSVKDNLLI